jgi:hypothetical protein
MYKTLVINTPDASRNNWKAVRSILNRHGFELSRYHSRIVHSGMCLVAVVRRPAGQEETTADTALADMPMGTTLHVLSS